MESNGSVHTGVTGLVADFYFQRDAMHRAACCVVFAALRKTPNRNAPHPV